MGSCMGRCITTFTDTFSNRSYQRHENTLSIEDNPSEIEQPATQSSEQDNSDESRSKKFLSLFTFKQFKQNRRVPVKLELIEEGWPGQSNKYERLASDKASISSGLDNSLQTLDARGLIGQQGLISSTSASSLDLEWEHEGMPTPIANNVNLDSPVGSVSEISIHNTQPSSLTASAWSRVSTPNSLEWDPVETDMVDIDTEKLLTEIEKLTDRALKETGEWTKSS